MLMFRNDYSYGAHPKVLEALCKTNLEGNIGYGDDAYTDRAKALIRELCACPEAMVEFLIGGTQTNVTACAFLLKPWEAVISPVTGHLNGHEVGAFEATGHKILPVEVGSDGKIFPEMLPPLLEHHKDPHPTKPALVYISNATENGTVYTKAELTALIRMDASAAGEALDLLMIAKYLERIGDHAVNVAEWVAYAITGSRYQEG